MYKYMSPEHQGPTFLQATVIRIHPGGESLDVAFYNDDMLYHDLYTPGLASTVPREAVEKFVPPKAGSPVLANYEGHGRWFPGKVVGIGPTGWAEILYADNDYEEDVSRRRYISLIE
jgi:hypothetical protein